MQKSSIEWTTFTANPIVYERKSDRKRVWACEKTSPGCKHCYAEALGKRYGKGAEFNAAEMAKLNVLVDMKQIRHMLTAKTIGGVPVDGSMVFIGDMTDVFGKWVPFELLDVLFAAFALRPSVTWQVLTKRPDRAREYLAARHGLMEFSSGGNHYRFETSAECRVALKMHQGDWLPANGKGFHRWPQAWPLPNVWIGTSCERQQEADERVPQLLNTPAAVRFISAEPLLGPIDLNALPDPKGDPSWDASALHGVRECAFGATVSRESIPRLDLVIGGGESGGGARPCEVDWLRSLRQQCQKAGVPFFCKQLGSHVIDRNDAGFDGDPEDSWTPTTRYKELTGKGWQGRSGSHSPAEPQKAATLSEWPADLRVRELPEVHA